MLSVKIWRLLVVSVLAPAILQSCASTGGVKGNENGSAPINSKEKLEYEKAVVRCLKTGGTRVVKVMGTLRCY